MRGVGFEPTQLLHIRLEHLYEAVVTTEVGEGMEVSSHHCFGKA